MSETLIPYLRLRGGELKKEADRALFMLRHPEQFSEKEIKRAEQKVDRLDEQVIESDWPPQMSFGMSRPAVSSARLIVLRGL